ncbi:DUF4365 domain-containing protein [Corallococcus sp. bb12-1]|uniref:DUF4365 domain-containing protein n=1 Tax=Corallococcus sp. bb12-1 TaxID=2996784 RepID=UPI0022702022|nr:DUF4365 domain-containing protein [Corallococcus sp. bb12-1]MCY1043087.1 DUF4365 domain-containing protein [Corallococcus sp. bb12-1]
MLTRPRAQVLETLSRRAFHEALPSDWRIQDPHREHGLDARVQPFEHRKAQGPAFFASIEPTDDGQGDDTGVAVTFRTERLREYLDAAHPVMLVGFHAPTNGLFFAWVHRLAASHSAEERMRWDFQKNVRLRLEDALRTREPDELLEEVREFFGVREAMPPPAPVRVRLELPPGDFSQEVHDSVASWMDTARSRVRLESAQAEVVLDVAADWSSIRLECSDLRHALPTSLSPEPTAEEAAGVVRLIASMALSIAGLRHDAAALLVEALRASAWPESTVARLLLQPVVWNVLFATEDFQDVLGAAEVLAARELIPQTLLAARVGLEVLRSRPDARRSEAPQRYRAMLALLLERTNEAAARSALHAHLAHHLRVSGLGREAVHHLRLAAMNDLGHLQRDDWWSGMAGALLLRGCARQAVACYAYAATLTEDRRVTALLAGAYFRLRRFGEAERLFSQWFDRNPELEPQRVLEHFTTPLLEQTFGSGRRQVGLAWRRAAEAAAIEDPWQQVDALQEALQLDPLCELAWAHFAQLKAEMNTEMGGNWWLARAVLTGHRDVTACFKAMESLNHASGQEAGLLRISILWLALRHHGERFYEEAERHFTSDSEGDPTGGYLEYLRGLEEPARTFFRHMEGTDDGPLPDE